MTSKTALVLGANGYIGRAVAVAFARAGYSTIGVVRSPGSVGNLPADGITPVIGSASDKVPLIQAVHAHGKVLDVIVTTTEQWPDYYGHFRETMALVKELAEVSLNNGTRSLVLFSSGCKDYGQTALHGAVGLAPHTETSPLNPPAALKPRTQSAPLVFDNTNLFDAAVLRPTNVHGGSSSHYGVFIELAKRAKEQNRPLVLGGRPDTIAHSVHVDDCGEAYVALADHPDRSAVAGQSFNISPGDKYETLQDIADALTKEYELEPKVACVPSTQLDGIPGLLLGWSQWVGSQKIRDLTGWRDRKPMFAEGMHTYREEYDQAYNNNDEGVRRTLARYGKDIDKLLEN